MEDDMDKFLEREEKRLVNENKIIDKQIMELEKTAHKLASQLTAKKATLKKMKENSRKRRSEVNISPECKRRLTFTTADGDSFKDSSCENMTGTIAHEDDVDDLQPCTSQQSNQSCTLRDDSIVTKQISHKSIQCANCKKK